jgi:hypothetical protein
MNEIAQEPVLYPEHTFHRRFTAYDRSAYPLREKQRGVKKYVVVIVTDMGSSGTTPKPQESLLWKAWNASLDQPLLQTRSGVLPQVREAWFSEGSDAARKPARPESKEGRIEEFLEQVYRLGDLNHLEEATDNVFRYIDDLLLEGQFPVCNEILKRADVKRLPTALLRSFLTITAPVKARLPARKAFYRDAFAEMVRVKGDTAKAQRLLGPLT